MDLETEISDFFIWLFRRHRHHRRRHHRKNVRNLEVFVNMKTATVTWTDPTPPLTGVEIALQKVGGADFVVVGTANPGDQTLQIPNLDDGDYVVRAVVLNGAARSSGVNQTFTVATPVDQTPGEVSNLSVTVA